MSSFTEAALNSTRRNLKNALCNLAPKGLKKTPDYLAHSFGENVKLKQNALNEQLDILNEKVKEITMLITICNLASYIYSELMTHLSEYDIEMGFYGYSPEITFLTSEKRSFMTIRLFFQCNIFNLYFINKCGEIVTPTKEEYSGKMVFNMSNEIEDFIQVVKNLVILSSAAENQG